MPAEGIEPTLPKERDFESRASASSATPACGRRRCRNLPAPVRKPGSTDRPVIEQNLSYHSPSVDSRAGQRHKALEWPSAPRVPDNAPRLTYSVALAYALFLIANFIAAHVLAR